MTNEPVRNKMDFDQVEIASVAELESWLSENHASHGTIWLVTFKKKHADKYVSKADVADAGMCYGWVDGSPKACDEDRTMRLFAKRKEDSIWSANNKKRVATLQKAGRMRPAGLAAVAAAKRNGMWSFLDDVHRRVQPDDLVESFNGHYGSKEGFESFSPSAQVLILKWIKMAKTPATRSARIQKTAEMAAKGLKSYGS